jgi:hypothetical protein
LHLFFDFTHPSPGKQQAGLETFWEFAGQTLRLSQPEAVGLAIPGSAGFPTNRTPTNVLWTPTRSAGFEVARIRELSVLAEGQFHRSLGQRPRKIGISSHVLAEGHTHPRIEVGFQPT